jgi:hypothetical protein
MPEVRLESGHNLRAAASLVNLIAAALAYRRKRVRAKTHPFE